MRRNLVSAFWYCYSAKVASLSTSLTLLSRPIFQSLRTFAHIILAQRCFALWLVRSFLPRLIVYRNASNVPRLGFDFEFESCFSVPQATFYLTSILLFVANVRPPVTTFSPFKFTTLAVDLPVSQHCTCSVDSPELTSRRTSRNERRISDDIQCIPVVRHCKLEVNLPRAESSGSTITIAIALGSCVSCR